MSVVPGSADRSKRPSRRVRQPGWRDGGLGLASVAGVAVAYLGTADTTDVAMGAIVAVSTAAGMHARLAMGRWSAGAQILACTVAVSALGAPPRLVGVVLVSGLGGAELIARCARRSAILQVGAWVALLASAASVSGLLATVALPPGVALREGVAAAVGGLLSAPLVLTVGPVAEWLFGHTTRLTMGEWLNYEHPLLRKLAAAAPGTFQHSISVGVLADAAAGAMNADALLARIGGLYHDVGKIHSPQYFFENQHDANPHDHLDPAESAAILRAHVVEGVTLVIAHRMGERTADFVREHHGTSEMRLLRTKAEERGHHADDDAFRYPGPKPRSRETGVVMIADQLEATARSNPPTDDAACDELVRTTIERIRGEGQLDDAGLTEQDLALAHGAFARALQAMYHRRLTYPPSGTEAKRPALAFLRRFGRRAVS